MKLLFAIPHFAESRYPFARNASLTVPPDERAIGLLACLRSLQVCFGSRQVEASFVTSKASDANNDVAPTEVEVVVCTTGDRHALEYLPASHPRFTHVGTNAQPALLGYECHAALSQRRGSYDYYCFIEDDLVFHDPWFFIKLRQFDERFGPSSVLQPNRFEVPTRAGLAKAYVDGDLPPGVIEPFVQGSRPSLVMDVLGRSCEFVHARNPHSGGFFLTSRQFEVWHESEWFLDRDTSFAGPLESAATLGLLRCFDVYKPAPSIRSFLEVEHYGEHISTHIGGTIEIEGPENTRPTSATGDSSEGSG